MRTLDTFYRIDNSAFNCNHEVCGMIVVLLLIILIHALHKLRQFSARPAKVTLSTSFKTSYRKLISYRNLIEIMSSQVNIADNSVLITSFCSRDCNRNCSEQELSNTFNKTYNIGGLSGIPFDGAKALIGILAGISRGENCFLMYGPHVNVDDEFLKKAIGDDSFITRFDSCSCTINAVPYSPKNKFNSTDSKSSTLSTDREQSFLNQLLLAYNVCVRVVSDKSYDLPRTLFDVQTALINRIVAKGCRHIQADQLIVIVGGIQCNTPLGVLDYFLPLRFDVVNRHVQVVQRFDFPEH